MGRAWNNFWLCFKTTIKPSGERMCLPDDNSNDMDTRKSCPPKLSIFGMMEVAAFHVSYIFVGWVLLTREKILRPGLEWTLFILGSDLREQE